MKANWIDDILPIELIFFKRVIEGQVEGRSEDTTRKKT